MKKIILAGGSGFLGQTLAAHFANNYEIVVLTRNPKSHSPFREVAWDGRTLGPWAAELEGAHVAINLTGRSVDCRYTPKNRRLIMDSRVEPTRVLGQAIASCKVPPALWLNSSTATIYKHTFDAAWDEQGEIAPTPEAKDFLSVEVAEAWEAEFKKASTPKTRKVALRSAMVLGGGHNSVFPVLRRLVRLGLGGKMGKGSQFVSWIHKTDFCRAVEWIIEKPELTGAINLCSPSPLTNTEMMRTLREVIGVPLGLPATPWMLEIGAFLLRTETELIIKSRRVVPRRLLESDFQFHFPTFREAAAELHRRM